VHPTLHALRKQRMDPAKLTRRTLPGRLPPPLEARLQPGVAWYFQQDTTLQDAHVGRIAALAVPGGERAASRLHPGRFTATAKGYIRVPVNGTHRFELDGFGEAQLRINGKLVLAGERDLRSAEP